MSPWLLINKQINSTSSIHVAKWNTNGLNHKVETICFLQINKIDVLFDPEETHFTEKSMFKMPYYITHKPLDLMDLHMTMAVIIIHHTQEVYALPAY